MMSYIRLDDVPVVIVHMHTACCSNDIVRYKEGEGS